MTTLNRIFHEPINTLTHLLGVIASIVGLIPLLLLTRHDGTKMLSLLIYGVSMIALYTASSLLHGVKANSALHMRLNRLDHVAIFLLIAGTYTPIAYNIFPPAWRWWVLGFVWLVTAVGSAYKLFSPRIHGPINASIYLILSWGAALPLFLVVNIMELISSVGFFLLLTGGLIYTVGFIVYYFEKPDPWPDVFGHHEIWHLFVLGGSLCHYLFMLLVVVPYERI